MKKKMILLVCGVVTAVLMTACNGGSGTSHPPEPEQPVASVVRAVDYGVNPDDGGDSAEAIRAAVAAAQAAEKPVTLSFAKGTYHIYPDRAFERELYISNTVGADPRYRLKKIGLLFENANDITVEGNGSKFVFHGKMTTFAAIGCRNLVLQNFTIDFETPTVVDLTVDSLTTEGSVPIAVYSVPECYDYRIDGVSIDWLSDQSPYTAERYWEINGVPSYAQLRTADGKTTRIGRPPILNNVKEITDLGGGRIKVAYHRRDEAIVTGACYQMRETVRDHAGMFFWECKDVSIKDVDSYYLHGFGIVGQYTENVNLERVRFAAPHELGRYSAGYADFIQMSGCKGQITVQDCVFDNPHDDPINIHGTFLQITERISDNRFKIKFMHDETAGFRTFYPGDKVEFVNRADLDTVFGAKVIAAEQISLTESIITVDRSVPSDVAAGTHAVENVTYVPKVRISESRFTSIPTRGILVTTREPVLIENNTFEHIVMAGIYVSSDARDNGGWFESGAVRDLTIRNNTFIDCGISVLIEPTNTQVVAGKPVHRNVTVENNVFEIGDFPVLKAKSTANLSFIGNTVRPLTGDEGSMRVPLFEFEGCFDAKLRDNVYGQGLNLTARLVNMPWNYLNNADAGLRIDI